MLRGTRIRVGTAAVVLTVVAGTVSAHAQTRAARDAASGEPRRTAPLLSQFTVTSGSNILAAAPPAPAPPTSSSKRQEVGTRAERDDDALTRWTKKTFKNFRPGSCKPVSHGAPIKPWLGHSEPAVTFCQS